jgi:metallophosphoesterase superfamily enzyme
MTATTMRYLIIPDVHDKIRRANQIIEREPHDHLLLLGDFFDDFKTGVTDASDTAKQVKQWLNDPNTTCLLGNHDMSYEWGRQNRRLICAGYDAAKWITIHGTLTARDWQQFKLHIWLEGDERPWLVTHAGIHPAWLKYTEPDDYRAHIDKICGDAWTRLNRGEHHFLLGCGASRSGDQKVGGINWMDWAELIPMPGLNQLVGHTPAQTVRHKDTPTSRNICLDTHLRHYAVFENGHLEIKTVGDLVGMTK